VQKQTSYYKKKQKPLLSAEGEVINIFTCEDIIMENMPPWSGM